MSASSGKRRTRASGGSSRFPIAVSAVALTIVLALAGAAAAQPSGGPWSDDFSTARRVASASGTKVSGGALKLSEGDPVDLGEAVPGESAVMSMVAVGDDIYCGTGSKGHLVRYDAHELYQEGYQGPSHYGVSSSKGQVAGAATTVTALVTDSSKVFGGTAAGHVFSFDPSVEGNRPVDEGQCPGVTGEVMCGAWYSSKAFFGTSDGYVFSYDDSGGTFASLGQVSGTSAVTSMAVVGGSLFAGLADGHVFEYAGVSFADAGSPDGTTVNALLGSGTFLYAGLASGGVYSYDTTGPGPFTDRGTLGGGAPVSALAERSGVVFAGAATGHLFSGLDTWTDEGLPANSGGEPVNALAVCAAGVLYGGTGDDGAGSTGRLFRRGVDTFEDFDRPSGAGDLTSIAFYGKTLYVVRGEHLYKFTAPGTYEDLGAPSAGSAINDIDARMGVVFLGLDNGHLFTYDSPAYPGAFHDEGAPAVPSPVRSVVAWSFSTIYAGLDDGRLMNGLDMDGAPLATLPSTSVEDMAYRDSGTGAPAGLYVAGGDGKLFRFASGSLSELGDGSDATAARALASYGDSVYVGHDSGNVYAYDGSFTALGTAATAVRSMAPAGQGVAVGSAGGRLYLQEESGALRDEGSLPNPGAVLSLCHTGTSIWAGSPDGYLASHDDAHLGDLGQQVNRQIMVWCMTYDPGRHVFYAGTYTNAHFLVIDPAGPTITDLGRPIQGERELEDIIVTREGEVVGCTYGGTESSFNPDGGHVFTYQPSPGDPSRGDFTDRGKAPAPDNNWWISSLVEGPSSGNLVYASTSNSAVDATHQQGRMFSVDKTTWAATDMGAPVAGEGVRSMTRKDDVIFGATWQPAVDDESSVFKHTIGGGTEVLGEAPTPPGGITANKHINSVLALGDTVYGAQNNGYVFSFAASAWDPTVLGKPVDQSTSVYPLTAGPDGTLLCGTTGGTDLTPEPGHLVSWDGALQAYRDIDVQAVTEATHQDRVASMAVGDDAVDGMTLCGTRGMFYDAANRYTAHIFEVPAYKSGAASTALSTVVDPALEELAVTFTGQDGIGAICPAPGSAKQVYAGTADGAGGSARLYRYDSMTELLSGGPWDVGAENVFSLCAGPDGNVYVGTGNDPAGADAALKRFDPLTGAMATLDDGGLLQHYKGIRALAAGPDGRIYLGAGDRDSSPGKLIAYDPGTGAFSDVGTLQPSPGRINGLAASGTKVVAVTGAQEGFSGTAEAYAYTPGGSLVSEGVIGSEHAANALVAGPGGSLYCATGPAGGLYRRAPGGSGFTLVGWPDSCAGKAGTALGATAASVYGCAGGEGNFFEYVPGSGFTDRGPITVDNSGVGAATTDNLGRLFFGTTGSGADSSVKLLRYNTAAAYHWLTAGADTVTPAGTSALAWLRNVQDTADVHAGPLGPVAAPTDIRSVTDRAFRFKAALETSDAGATPEVTAWEAAWQVDAAIDQFVYPYAEGAYPGDTLGVWGTGFGASGSATVGGQPATVGIWQPGFVSLQIPAGTTSSAIVLTPGGGGDAASSTFDLLSPPHLTEVSPPHARLGDYVDIYGSGFLASRGEEESVSFNGTAATGFAYWSDTHISVRVPQGATTGPLAVSVNHHASNQMQFTVDGGGDPTVRITAPEDGAALKGEVQVTATVQRSDGGAPVELWVDGVKKAADPFAPYAFRWDSDAVADGAHTLTVKATDAYGRTGSDSATVYVDHTVPTESKNWYFAEGCTDYGFETWVLIGNPDDEAAVAHVTFLDSQGETYRLACEVLANSRLTINAADVAPGKSVSVHVEADRAVVCERSMYWSGRVEGHDTVGSTSLARDWYFAEGSTDWGFETFTLLCNPGDARVRATLEYMFTDGTTATKAHELEPHTRLTVNAADEVGARDFSVRVRADAPGIVAERSMYHGNRRCGTNTIGCKEPSLTWYLSEGSTDWGFETWLLIQRPGADAARVNVSYRLDSGETVRKVYDVEGNSRFTVNLMGEVGVADVSTQVTSNVPVVCERSMYWSGRAAGHCTIGSPGPGRTWFLAEGCTDFGFETWILLDNPSSVPVNATVTFLKEDGTTVPVALTLQPASRFSLDASTRVGACSFSTRIDAASPVMVERAMYWRARSGGTGSIGAR